MKKFEVLNDAIVTYEDALRWVEELYKQKPDDVIERALEVEPAVVAVAANLGKRTCARLEKAGVPPCLILFVDRQIALAGAMAVELMRKGSARLWSDLIEPEEPEKKEGDSHE
jgi:hypothetical protein